MMIDQICIVVNKGRYFMQRKLQFTELPTNKVPQNRAYLKSPISNFPMEILHTNGVSDLSTKLQNSHFISPLELKSLGASQV